MEHELVQCDQTVVKWGINLEAPPPALLAGLYFNLASLRVLQSEHSVDEEGRARANFFVSGTSATCVMSDKVAALHALTNIRSIF